ncbi:MAG TPA: tetratricopeptide repeat protein, partial [Sedimentisphaerales bacterium]|nr:tetratricopeptide repeat protein [Sedimentisphaerales bacterium]
AISGGFNRLVWGIVPAVLLGLLIVRPLILTYEVGTNMAVAVVVVVFLLLLPLVFFAVTFLLLSVRDDVGAFPDTAQAMLTIGLIGVIIHNCIDFALFEPGIMAFIWACAAAIVSLDFIRGKRSPRQVTISGNRRWAAWGAAALGATAFVWFVLIPVPATEFLKAQASLALDNGDIAEARRLYGIATDVDKLSSEAPHSAGRLYLFEFRNSFPDLQLIDAAERAIHTAIDRNPAAHEYRAMLAEVYATAAQIAQGDVRTAWLEKAHSAATEAVIRYPGDAAARIALADIADDLGRSDEALEQYIEAVAIERAYRELFVRMHPDRELHSRLGENKYQYARSRIAELSARSD